MYAANTVIENLLQRKKAQAAMVLDALYITDAIKLQSIEIYSILHYFKLSGIAIGESIVRKGLFQLAELGLFSVSKKMTRSKGRPLWHYTPKTSQKIAEKLNVKLHRDENADPVPFAAFKNTASYRAAKHYSHIFRLGKSTPSRKKLGARLGVQGRSTYNYEIGTRISVKPRFDTIALSKADIIAAPEKRLNANIYLEVHFMRELSDFELAEKFGEYEPTQRYLFGKEISDVKKMPYTRFILERELERGNRVYLTKQITNEYSISA